jgi:hemoglobin
MTLFLKQPSLYEALGKEAGVKAIVDRFYELMDTLPEAATIRAMHPADLSNSSEKLFMFLVGRFGGPNLYIEKHGHPRLRGRHMPFAINAAAVEAWMTCMSQALKELVEDPELRVHVENFLAGVADFMKNRPDQPAG